MITSIVIGYLMIPGSVLLPVSGVAFLWRKYGKRVH